MANKPKPEPKHVKALIAKHTKPPKPPKVVPVWSLWSVLNRRRKP